MAGGRLCFFSTAGSQQAIGCHCEGHSSYCNRLCNRVGLQEGGQPASSEKVSWFFFLFKKLIKILFWAFLLLFIDSTAVDKKGGKIEGGRHEAMGREWNRTRIHCIKDWASAHGAHALSALCCAWKIWKKALFNLGYINAQFQLQIVVHIRICCSNCRAVLMKPALSVYLLVNPGATLTIKRFLQSSSNLRPLMLAHYCTFRADCTLDSIWTFFNQWNENTNMSWVG